MSDEKKVSEWMQAHRKDLYHKIPAELESRVLESLDSKSSARQKNGWPLATAVCGVLALFLGLTRWPPSPTNEELLTQEVISGHVRSLMANHLMDVASTDQHTVKPWFEGKLDFSPLVKDFAQDGFPLVGGRIDYLETRPVAALVYKSRQHVINVFEWPSLQTSNSQPKLISRRGYQIYLWSKDSMNFWVISDLNAAELQNFARHLDGRLD